MNPSLAGEPDLGRQPNVGALLYDFDGQGQPTRDDLALVFLPAGSVSGIAPANLPSLDLLGTMARQGSFRGVLFENVGYGGSMAFKKGPPQLSYPTGGWSRCPRSWRSRPADWGCK